MKWCNRIGRPVRPSPGGDDAAGAFLVRLTNHHAKYSEQFLLFLKRITFYGRRRRRRCLPAARARRSQRRTQRRRRKGREAVCLHNGSFTGNSERQSFVRCTRTHDDHLTTLNRNRATRAAAGCPLRGVRGYNRASLQSAGRGRNIRQSGVILDGVQIRREKMLKFIRKLGPFRNSTTSGEGAIPPNAVRKDTNKINRPGRRLQFYKIGESTSGRSAGGALCGPKFYWKCFFLMGPRLEDIHHLGQ
ncbi:hypothetical protein EVAR_93347_1 [Eumeta japonica]|uniref:Uncharacterized protein n=1 Tax=Eumeta variegata TaxID=151549 RepID=A0A4C1UTK0_EUMVA|nr:hypothetical protein EVAR_93347_1 [Eumeta japonica]